MKRWCKMTCYKILAAVNLMFLIGKKKKKRWATEPKGFLICIEKFLIDWFLGDYPAWDGICAPLLFMKQSSFLSKILKSEVFIKHIALLILINAFILVLQLWSCTNRGRWESADRICLIKDTLSPAVRTQHDSTCCWAVSKCWPEVTASINRASNQGPWSSLRFRNVLVCFGDFTLSSH